jgi:predicted NUDIX family NTP pyrophosphohydrolase
MKRKFTDRCNEILSEKKKPGKIVTTAGIALIHNNKIFLVKPFNNNGKRSWGIPKGKADPGESIELCARREFTEETGFTPKTDLEYLGKAGYSGTSTYPGKDIHAFVGYGTGKEKFKGSNLIDHGPDKGKPEIINGKYIDIKEAKDIIHKSQIKFIELLMDKFNL